VTNHTRYSLYVLAAGFLAAVAVVLTEIAIKFYGVAPLVAIILGNLIGGLFLLGSSARRLSREKQLVSRWQNWIPIVAAALSIYTLGFLASFNAIGLVGSSKVALLGQLETLFVVTLAIIFLGEQFTPRHWLSGILAITGAILINFDPRALQLTFGWGELLAVLAPLGLALGIIILKPLLDKADARWVTGLALLLGAAFLSPFVLLGSASMNIGWAALFVLAGMGTTRGSAWLSYNMAMRHIGPSRCAIVFLSFGFFTVIVQAVVAALGPQLGLQLPTNWGMTLLGGVLVAAGIVVLQTGPVHTSDEIGPYIQIE